VSGLPWSARRHAAFSPDAPAVIDGPLTLSWAQLDARADSIAAALLAAGAKTGGRVALLARSSARAISFLHGAGRAGVVVVPLNSRLAPAELAVLMLELDVSFVAADGESLGLAHRLRPPVLSLAELMAVPKTGLALPPKRPASAPPAVISPDAPAVIVGTSGTTGRPKGAVLTWGALTASAEAWNLSLPPATGWLSSLSIAHVGGLGIIWRSALSGAPIVIPAGNDQGSLAAAIANPLVSHISLVAVQLTRLLESGTDAPASLRAVLLGGGPIPPDLVTRALAAGWPVVPTYGMTETASGVTALTTADAPPRPGSAGRPLLGVDLRIENPAQDGIGEIEVRGPSLFFGYFGLLDETAAEPGIDGWFRTGDLGSIDAGGYLTVADRRLDLIISGGENIYPAEIEAALLSHPAVADAGVVGRPDKRWGAVPVAFVVMRYGAWADDEELRAHCAERLARFKLPVEFITWPEIPRVGAGKIDRRRLRGMAATLASRPPAAAPAVPPTPSTQAMPQLRYLDREDGFRLAYRLIEAPAPDAPTILVLHPTLSSGLQLKSLARLLAGWSTVVLPDRRGSRASRLDPPRPVKLDEQVADAVALLDDLGVADALVFGHSYGAVVALALAAAHPDRVQAVIAYEPPLLDALSPEDLGEMTDVAAQVRAAHAAGGAAAATQAFLHAIGGEDALATASAAGRAALLADGDGVLADVGSMADEHVDLTQIVSPVTLVTGDASEPFYASIADAAAAALPNAARVRLPDLRHHAPITQPEAIAELVRKVARDEAGRKEVADRAAWQKAAVDSHLTLVPTDAAWRLDPDAPALRSVEEIRSRAAMFEEAGRAVPERIPVDQDPDGRHTAEHSAASGWSAEMYNAMYPPSFLEAIAAVKAGDRSSLEAVLRFLEADPWCFGSGYVKADVIPPICRFQLDDAEVVRLRSVVLAFVDCPKPRRELRSYVNLARRVANPDLRSSLQERLQSADPFVRYNAQAVLDGLDRDQPASHKRTASPRSSRPS
jgi:O-succinylbenzoic acid--CoA ligase